MIGKAASLSDFIEGSKTQFIIPVYQRNYDWLVDNCDQLFDDLINLKGKGKQTHFFGSIVTAPADDYGHNRLIIDGQQRITTISLLLMAGMKAVKDGLLPVSSHTLLEKADETLLVAKYCVNERKIKLVPIENDRIAYDCIYRGEEDKFVAGSKITRNFNYFYQRLAKAPENFSFDDLMDVVERLQIIDIALDHNDDAQLIFESLNSTGLALTEADKIRNYLLMSLSPDNQQRCFKDYWQKIEESTDNDPTMFLRDYLTLKQQLQRHVRLQNLYKEWKKYMHGKDREQELAEMTLYARYHYQVTKARLKTEKLSEKMRHMCNLETDVINVFFVQFLKYADEKELGEDETWKVIDVIENYMARRIICNMPGNSLTQVCCALHRDVLKSIDEYEKAGVPLNYGYLDILTYHIMRRDGNYQLPRDAQFEEAIKTRDVYRMLKPYQVFLFERLENAVPGENNDVARELKDKTATIEHIMPQTLNSDWVVMLGSDYEAVKEKYLHTFANLTLTGINSELSNKSFDIKKNGRDFKGTFVPGYVNSKYRLTRSVTKCERWTAAELENRGKEIVETFMRLYPLPATDFKPLPKSVDEVSLEDEDFSPKGRSLKGFRLFGEEYAETSWKSMMLTTVSIVSDKYPDESDSLYDDVSNHDFWREGQFDPKFSTLVSPGKYVYTNLDNKGKLRSLRTLFERCDVPESELVLIMDIAKD